GGDPEEPELHVPRPRQAVWQPSGQRDTVEAVSFNTVVRDNPPGQDLQQEKRGHHDEVLHGGTLRRRRAQADQRVPSGSSLERRRRGHSSVEPDDEADAARSRRILTPVHMTASAVGTLPMSGSWGQLLV